MNLSYKILSVFGIDIELHLFFILFILAFALLSLQLALLLVLIFFFVTLHELTHSIVAIRNNIRVRKIVLLPIGGMAMVESADIKPITEIKMSLAGPLFNIIMVYICLAIAYVFSLPLGSWLVDFFSPTQAFTLGLPELVLFYSFYANLILGVFNLFLPAFPLDGGRIFRALLALKLDYIRASRIAKNVSLSISAFLFVIAFVYGEIWIMIISFFIAFGAVSEFNAMLVHKSLARVKTKDVLSKNFLSVKASDSIAGVLSKMLAKKTTNALVTGRVTKVVNLADIAKLPKDERNKRAGSIARPVAPVQLSSPIEKVVGRMETDGVYMLPVFDGKKMVGAVERAEIEKMIKILETLRRGPR